MTSSYLQSYEHSVGIGLLLFLLLAAVVLVPVAAVRYVRFGRLEPRRWLTVCAALLYGTVLFSLVFLPLPARDEVCGGWQTTQWIPFDWVADVGRELSRQHGIGLGAALHTRAFLGFACNVALFVPFGVLARLPHGWGVRRVVLAAFVVSCAIELAQGTGNLGMYPCAYRIMDVDDVIANTIGAGIGALLVSLVRRTPAPVPSRGDDHAYLRRIG